MGYQIGYDDLYRGIKLNGLRRYLIYMYMVFENYFRGVRNDFLFKLILFTVNFERSSENDFIPFLLYIFEC